MSQDKSYWRVEMALNEGEIPDSVDGFPCVAAVRRNEFMRRKLTLLKQPPFSTTYEVYELRRLNKNGEQIPAGVALRNRETGYYYVYA